MYLPTHFVEDNLETIHALIRARPLGLLISANADDLQANAVPFILNADAGPNGVLKAHVARANPQWQHLKDGERALVVFQGPDAYVTPSWYVAKKEHGKVVPTWNYAMVQVRGAVTVHEHPDWLMPQVTALTDAHESARAEPWAVTDAPERFVNMQMRAIVGIEIAIEDIRGKWKVSQNRSGADQAGVAEGMVRESEEDMAALVRRFGKTDPA
jgi:transcriptional regulator